MAFAARKQAVLSSLSSGRADLSPKGFVDDPIVDLIQEVNSVPSLVTVSSCSGRVAVFLQPPRDAAARGKGGRWLLVEHAEVEAERVREAVREGAAEGGTVDFRHEPFILAVECETLAAAARLLRVAREAGCRESGIGSVARRVVLSVRTSLRIEAPVADGGRVLASDDYIGFLVEQANAKFRANAARTDRFLEAFRREFGENGGGSEAAAPAAAAALEADAAGLAAAEAALAASAGARRAREAAAGEQARPERGLWCVLCPRRACNPIKRALDERGWLTGLFRNKTVRPGPAAFGDGTVSLPLSAAGLAAVRAACVTAGTFPGVVPLPGLDGAQVHFVSAAELSPPRAAAKAKATPHARMRAAVRAALAAAGVPAARAGELAAATPKKWEVLGDVLLLPHGSMLEAEAAAATAGGDAAPLWRAVASAVPRVSRVARQAPVDPGATRQSRARLLLGADGWVRHRDNGVTYCLDVTETMFSSGNGTEKKRVGSLCREGDVVADLYAGCGFFTVPYLVHGRSARVHACELHPPTARALRATLEANGVSDRCEVHEGDCAAAGLLAVADRVNLGLIPSSRGGWPAAVRALRPAGGWLHVHANALDGEENADAEACAREIERLARETGDQAKGAWRAEVRHVERVKWYAPRVRHVVFDIEVK